MAKKVIVAKMSHEGKEYIGKRKSSYTTVMTKSHKTLMSV